MKIYFFTSPLSLLLFTLLFDLWRKLLIFTDTLCFVACGASLRELEGNITGPTTLPFNQTSYVCHWKLEPPENMISLSNDTGLTLTIKVTGNLGGHESENNIKRNCFFPQYIELQGKRYDLIFLFSLIDGSYWKK